MPEPSPIYIPNLTGLDARFLGNLLVAGEPEPNFQPPGSLSAFLERYPRGMHEAVREICTALDITPLDNSLDLDDVAQELVLMYLDFAQDLEDVVESYTMAPPRTAGQSRSAPFHAYIKFQVRASLLSLVDTEFPASISFPLVRLEV